MTFDTRKTSMLVISYLTTLAFTRVIFTVINSKLFDFNYLIIIFL